MKMHSFILRVISGVCLICPRAAISHQNIRINSDAITFPETNGDDDIVSNLPFLHGINLNTKDKVQSTKTPIQRSSEAFALDLIRVSC